MKKRTFEISGNLNSRHFQFRIAIADLTAAITPEFVKRFYSTATAATAVLIAYHVVMSYLAGR